ncbi:MAG: type IV pilus assembly protein PilE [Paraglaciecola sp.]|jgi:type IV pilus assembly protein PilE
MMNKQLACHKKSKGFTLIELMIAVAIVGIIATIAYPSYQGMLQKSSRSVAQADLMALAAAMERHKAATYTYKGAAVSAGDTGAPTVFYSHSPSAEPVADRRYDLTIDTMSSSGTSYLIKATPLSGGPQAGDGNLFFYSDGRKAWDKDSNGSVGSSEYCWSC